MPYLNYYRDERQAFPEWTSRKLNFDDASRLSHELCRFIGIPALEVKALRVGSGWGGLFRWKTGNWTLTKAWFEYPANRPTSVHTIVHEVAHYWDYYMRFEQIAMLKARGTSYFEFNRAARKIYKRHGHGRFHWHLMELLMGMITTFKDVSPIFARSQPMELDSDPEFAHQIASIRKDYSLKLAEKNELTKLFRDLAAYRESLTANLQSASMAA